MKIDSGYFYNVEPFIDLEHFVELFLISLANFNKLSSYSQDEKKEYTAVLPLNYKDNIYDAMFGPDALSFLHLINHYDYYENQSNWEYKLSEEINKYLMKNNKKLNYNFQNDRIEISFYDEEITKILEKYDSSIKNTMKNFISYIDILGEKRYNRLTEKETKRNIRRQYIKISEKEYSNTWNNI